MRNFFLKVKSLRKCKAFPISNGTKNNKGMTYVELIVVLAIFSILSTVVIFNYGAFQSNVDIKNLASDIALQVSQAQNSSLAGIQPPAGHTPSISDWKPSYGVHFSTVVNPPNPVDSLGGDYKHILYFADLDQSGGFQSSNCTTSGECLNKFEITKGNYISNINIDGTCDAGVNMAPPDLNIFFKRPDSGATIKSSGFKLSGSGLPANSCHPLNFAKITVRSPSGTTGTIKLYPSGRVQIN